MLPFLRRNEGGSTSSDATIKVSDNPDKEFDLLDAICEDLCYALEVPVSKVEHVKAAIESLVDYIQSQDKIQDEEDMT